MKARRFHPETIDLLPLFFSRFSSRLRLRRSFATKFRRGGHRPLGQNSPCDVERDVAVRQLRAG
jgi:hypothetical protein